LAPAILGRACQPFPGEPIRTLDALHLATAIAASTALDGLTLLTVDRRLWSSAQALGLSVAPGG
jgi:hypothetical protein